MHIVIIPFALMLVIILVKKIPLIGGEVKWAMLIAGAASLLIGGVFSPIAWFQALFNGVNNLSWIIMLITIGGIFSEINVQDGAMDTFLNFMRASFGHTPKGLLVTMMVFLVIAGSLFGDAAASVTVIGFLGIQALAELQLSGEKISAAIVMGAAMGSIMPPITQAIFLSASLVGLDPPTSAVNWTFLTIGLGAALMCFYASAWVKIPALPEELIPKERPLAILKKGWKSLLPILLLIVIVLLQTANIQVLSFLDFIFVPISNIPIIKGLSQSMVKAIIVAALVAFLYKPVYSNALGIIKGGLHKVGNPLILMVCAAFLVGAFRSGGQVAAVADFAMGLNNDLLKIGGSGAMVLTGMLTGLQSATQTTIFTVFGPALTAIGVTPTNAAVAGAHLAMAGQGAPPADMLTFFTAGLVSGILGKKVDPMKSMLYSLPMCIYYIIVALIFLYI